jgi:1-acyl-sn-glycerol-3-phosphate acyltransferase
VRFSRFPLVYALVRGWSDLSLRVLHRMRVRGLDHVPRQGGAILVSNHASFLDPMALAGSIRFRILHFMARDTLCKAPGIGWLMPRLQLILIDRERGDVAAMKATLRLLKEGELVGLFPEGTRTPDGNLQSARGGIGFLIAKARVPVIPVYVEGTYRALSRHHRFPRPARVTVTFGPPIPPEELDALGTRREALRAIADLIMERIAALREPAAGVAGK